MSFAGQTLGRYQVLNKIDEGSMGEVYRGYDPILDREVAIKFLSPTLTNDANFVQRFQLEARTLAQLMHPHIVPVLDANWEQARLYMVMAYVGGGTLQEKIQAGSSTLSQMMAWLSQIASGLDYAHRLGLVHRDIKPNNILLNAQGEAQITDFGLVKHLAMDVSKKITMQGQILGTPAYMAPEQVQGLNVMPQTDVYALGIIAYEMLTGKVPFDGTMSNIFYAHVHQPPPPLRAKSLALPPTVEAVIFKALAKNPLERYPSATAFVQALEKALPRTVIVSPPPSKRTWWSRVRSEMGSALALLTVLFLGICALCSFGVYQLFLTPTPTPTDIADAPSISPSPTPTTISSTPTSPPASPTVSPLPAFTRTKVSEKTSVFWKSDRLEHTDDDEISIDWAENIILRDFEVEATFLNPYAIDEGTWDIGFIFRHEAGNKQFRLVVQSDGSWALLNNTGTGDGEFLAEGKVSNLDTTPNGSNQLALMVSGDKGTLTVNQQAIAEIELSMRMNTGAIGIGTGFFEDHEIEGEVTRYRDFTIWATEAEVAAPATPTIVVDLRQAKTLAEMDEIISYREYISMRGEGEAFDSDEEMLFLINGLTVESAFVKNPAAKHTVVHIPDFGKIEFITIDDRAYANFDDQWSEVSPEEVFDFDEVSFIEPEDVADEIEQFEFIAAETLSGRQTFHLRADTEILTQLDPDGQFTEKLAEARMDLWIDKAENFIVKMELSMTGKGVNENLPEAEGHLKMTREYYDFNKNIVIDPPVVTP